MNKIKIGEKFVGGGQPCFVIAEAGVNHNGKLELAKKLVDAAKSAGADAVKFQTWKTEELLTKSVPMAGYQKKTKTNEQNQYELIKKLELGKSDFKKIKEYCEKVGIIFLSTPGDRESADFLEELGAPAFKIGSDDLTNVPLLEYVAKKGKPVILSTGMGTMEEVQEAVKAIESTGNRQIILLHCTSEYPAPLEDVNLRAMETLRQFECPVGYSDHTLGIEVSVIAAAMGASIVEKHFTVDKNLQGPDQKMSLSPAELKNLVREVRRAGQKGLKSLKIPESKLEVILGSPEKQPTKTEAANLKFLRKKLVAKVAIKAGSKITEKELGVKRTEKKGLEPKFYNELIGKVARVSIKKDASVTFEDVGEKMNKEKGWDSAWEEVFKKQEWGKYPPEELIRFIARNFYAVPDRKKIKILDIGCGTGAATWYVAREGFSALGIDGSEAGIDVARKRFEKEGLKADFRVGDIVRLPYGDNTFDAVIDVCAIQHNTPESTQKILGEIQRVLKPGGKFFSMMVAERTTLREYYGNFGTTHFFSQNEIEKLLNNFKNVQIEISDRTSGNQSKLISHFVVTAEKK